MFHFLGASAQGLAKVERSNGRIGIISTKYHRAKSVILRVPLASCLRPCSVPYCTSSTKQNTCQKTAFRPQLIGSRYPSVWEWYHCTRLGMAGVGLSFSTTYPVDLTFTLGAFEAALALAVVEGTCVNPPNKTRPRNPNFTLLQSFPLMNMLLYGTEEKVTGLRYLDSVTTDEVAFFHASFLCLEQISRNLSDLLLRKYNMSPTGNEELINFMYAAVLAVRSKILWLPSLEPSYKGSSHLHPIFAPLVCSITDHRDVIGHVNCRALIDEDEGTVRVETLQAIRPNEEIHLHYLLPSPSLQERATMSCKDLDEINSTPCPKIWWINQSYEDCIGSFPQLSQQLNMILRYGVNM
eukprot:Tbor_TRINITY_DN401_c0_g1::TRINITY_DN401_c0_g1_i1::g.3162::m.3162